MSWWDTSSIINQATSALKQAQKHIDKALDIKEEEEGISEVNVETTSTPTSPSDKAPQSNLKLSDEEASQLAATKPLKVSTLGSSTKRSKRQRPLSKTLSTEFLKSADETKSESSESLSSGESQKADQTSYNPQCRSSENLTELKTDVSESETSLSPNLQSSITSKNENQSMDENSQLENNIAEIESDEPSIQSVSVSKSQSESEILENVDISESNEHSFTISDSTEIINPVSETGLLSDITAQSLESSTQESVSTALDFVQKKFPTSEDSVVAATPDESFSVAEIVSSSSPDLYSDYVSEDSNQTLHMSSDNSQIISQAPSNSHLDNKPVATESYTDVDIPPKITTEESSVSEEIPRRNEETQESSDCAPAVPLMLAEAMSENLSASVSPASVSPPSSSSSDIIKITSARPDSTACTELDEVETTTSSDIEIISTPNGDRRSLTSGSERMFDMSPLRGSLGRMLQRKQHSLDTHHRSDSGSSVQSEPGGADVGLSEALARSQQALLSRIDDRDSNYEINERKDQHHSANPLDPDKLLKKLADLAEVLEAREKRLLELGKENIGLQETNSILQNQLNQLEDQRSAENADVEEVTAEFTERLTEAERKLQSTVKERNLIKKQLLEAEESLNKCSNASSATDKLMKEKDVQISELLSEGEKLSKQQLQSNNTIKKLRVKEKETESVIKSLKTKLEKQTEELSHMRMVCDAKEEIEHKQIDAINQLNTHTKKLERENQELKSTEEDSQERIRSLQVTLDNSYKEIAELHKTNVSRASDAQEAALRTEREQKDQLRLTLDTERAQASQDRQTLLDQLDDLRAEVTRVTRDRARHEDRLKQDAAELHQRLQDAEDRNHDLSQSVSAATRPLLRQIENLTSNFNAQILTYEKVEKSLTERLAEAQSNLALAEEKDRQSVESSMDVQARLTSLESQVTSLRHEKSRLTAQVELERSQFSLLEENKINEVSRLEAALQSSKDSQSEIKNENNNLRSQIEMEKIHTETAKKKLQSVQESLREKELMIQSGAATEPISEHFTPQLSRASSVANELSADDSFDRSLSRSSAMHGSLYESVRRFGGGTNLVEHLEAQLKLREGEISQLQNELADFESTRESMARELVIATSINEELTTKNSILTEAEIRYQDLDSRYNALLQMYGEKVEESNELKLDLQDVKEMYKSQISELLRQQ